MNNAIVRMVQFVVDEDSGPDRLMQLKVEDAEYLLSLLKRVPAEPTNGFVDIKDVQSF